MRIFLYAGLKERPAVFLDKLFSFLGVETGFRPNAMDRRANRGQYASAEVTAAMLHLVDRLRAYPLTRQGVDFLKKTRVGRTLARRIFDSGEQGVDPAVRWELWDCFREDVALLEQVTGRSDLTARWAPGDGAPAR